MFASEWFGCESNFSDIFNSLFENDPSATIFRKSVVPNLPSCEYDVTHVAHLGTQSFDRRARKLDEPFSPTNRPLPIYRFVYQPIKFRHNRIFSIAPASYRCANDRARSLSPPLSVPRIAASVGHQTRAVSESRTERRAVPPRATLSHWP